MNILVKENPTLLNHVPTHLYKGIKVKHGGTRTIWGSGYKADVIFFLEGPNIGEWIEIPPNKLILINKE